MSQNIFKPISNSISEEGEKEEEFIKKNEDEKKDEEGSKQIVSMVLEGEQSLFSSIITDEKINEEEEKEKREEGKRNSKRRRRRSFNQIFMDSYNKFTTTSGKGKLFPPNTSLLSKIKIFGNFIFLYSTVLAFRVIVAVDYVLVRCYQIITKSGNGVPTI
nr:MAG: hypothetical protein [Porcellio scaber clopovirus]